MQFFGQRFFEMNPQAFWDTNMRKIKTPQKNTLSYMGQVGGQVNVGNIITPAESAISDMC